ncbi:MAG TPA: polysaccharide deacetylase family protein [Pirellulales bacterium]|nr:polysaccharide deacetylase family protein [Pirellulales bacterium]
MSWWKLGASPQPGIRFICYHDVKDNEINRLESQLMLMRELGAFIGIDDALDRMDSQSGLDQPLFTVTFDDGLETTYRNAWPVCERLGLPMSVYVITGFVGQPRYMSWDNIAQMAKSPLVRVGSHSVTHRNLAQLTSDEVRSELTQSKATIEQRLGVRCDHFCCPRGRPSRDFIADRDPRIAVDVGYRSFLTTQRGLTHRGDRPPLVKRDVLHMHSSKAELRHFLY